MKCSPGTRSTGKSGGRSAWTSQIVHVPSDLIAAYDPNAIGSLIGDKANSVVFDNSKIKQLVPDFHCTVPWSEGVRRAIAWFEADPARQTIDDRLNNIWDKILAEYAHAFPVGWFE